MLLNINSAMMSLTVSTKLNGQEIAGVFQDAVGSVNFSKVYSNGQSELFIATGSKFFFRSNDTIGFFLSAFYDGRETKVDFGRVGGGSGLLNIRWGAGNKVEENIKAGIQKLAENAGALVNDGTS
jgi:hypothetical protein